MFSPDTFATYKRIIMSQWPVVFEQVNQCTKVAHKNKELPERPNEMMPLLTTEQLEEISLDKQHTFIFNSISARAHTLIALLKIDNQLLEIDQQEKRAEQLLADGKKRSSLDQSSENALENLSNLLKKLKKQRALIVKSQGKIIRLLEKMDTLNYKQMSDWEKFKTTWSEKLIELLKSTKIPLTELEEKEIMRPKTTAELIDRMKELGMEIIS